MAPGGRLVFLYPVDKTIEKEGEMFPRHKSFQFNDHSECPMSSKKSRYVLTYTKNKWFVWIKENIT